MIVVVLPLLVAESQIRFTALEQILDITVMIINECSEKRGKYHCK